MIKIKKADCLNLSKGNMKLKGDAKNKFLIWNIPACKTCPFRTALCEKYCYAKKAERIYPNVLPSRERNLLSTQDRQFVNNMVNTIQYYLNLKSSKGKMINFRIHESGDFYRQSYAHAWTVIAEHFKDVENIRFLAYTKSVQYLRAMYIPKNLVIRYSVWSDTKASEYELAKKLQLPIYEAITKEEASTYTGFICEGNCQKCKACYSNTIKKIACVIH